MICGEAWLSSGSPFCECGMRAARVDANQSEIVECFKEFGFSVQTLHTVGHGVPDLLIGKHGKNWLIEVKDGAKRKLTCDQEKWHSEWRGQVTVIYNVDQATEFANNAILGRLIV